MNSSRSRETLKPPLRSYIAAFLVLGSLLAGLGILSLHIAGHRLDKVALPVIGLALLVSILGGIARWATHHPDAADEATTSHENRDGSKKFAVGAGVVAGIAIMLEAAGADSIFYWSSVPITLALLLLSLRSRS